MNKEQQKERAVLDVLHSLRTNVEAGNITWEESPRLLNSIAEELQTTIDEKTAQKPTTLLQRLFGR